MAKSRTAARDLTSRASFVDAPDSERVPRAASRNVLEEVAPKGKRFRATSSTEAMMALLGGKTTPMGGATPHDDLEAAPPSVKEFLKVSEDAKVRDVGAEFDPFTGDGEESNTRSLPALPTYAELEAQAPVRAQVPRQKSAYDRFFEGPTVQVQYQLNDGTLVTPALAVKEGPYCVTVVVRTGNGHGMMFIPKTGSTLGLSVGGGQFKSVYFPGTYETFDEIGIGVLMFMKEESRQ